MCISVRSIKLSRCSWIRKMYENTFRKNKCMPSCKYFYKKKKYFPQKCNKRLFQPGVEINSPTFRNENFNKYLLLIKYMRKPYIVYLLRGTNNKRLKIY